MVATVIINELTGSTPTKTDKTSGVIRFKNADSAGIDTNNPMVSPVSGNSDYSFEKWLRCEVTVAPDIEISNLEAYADGTMFGGSLVEVYGKVIASHSTPAEATGTTGTPSTPSGTVNIELWTSGAPQSLSSGSFSGTGDMGDHIVLIMEVKAGAVQGALSAETFTIRYDEI